MPQVQQKVSKGFGVVYPGGGSMGLKVVKTFTQGSTKMVHPDGSVTFSTPPPTIHELFGGGFAYADGSPVTNRDHLELITDAKMKERGLQWYDAHGKAITPEDVVVKEDGMEPQRPEPAYILSNQLPEGALEQGAVEIPREQVTVDSIREKISVPLDDTLTMIAKGISDLTTVVAKQGEEIAKLQASKTTDNWRAKQGNTMANKWHDPEFRKKMAEARKARKQSVQEPIVEPKEETPVGG